MSTEPVDSSATAVKRQNLKDQRQALLEEYQAANGQLARRLSDPERVRLERQLSDLEKRIAKNEADLAALEQPAAVSSPSAASPSATANALTPSRRRHLETQYAELQARYDNLSRRVAALDTDSARELDRERAFVLRERRSDLVVQREMIVARLNELEYQLAAVSSIAGLRLPSKHRADVFISYGGESRPWVEGWLVPELEHAGIRSIVGFRNFVPGRSIVAQLEDAIQTCRFVCIVVTPAHVNSEWFGVLEVLISSTTGDQRPRVIPLIREEAPLPMWLQRLSFIDFTGERDWNSQLGRLIIAVGGKPLSPASTELTTDPYSVSAIRSILTRRFDMDDLRMVALEVGLNVAAMRLGSVSEFATDIVTDAEQLGRIAELVRAMRVQQPMLRITDEILAASGSTSPVRDFLLKAGFEFTAVDDTSAFLAVPRTTYWSMRFPRGLYVRVLPSAALRSSDVQSIHEGAKNYTPHALVVIDQQPEVNAWMRIGELRADEKQRFYLLPVDHSLIKESLALGDERRTLQNYVEKKLGKSYDPFDIRDPVSDALSFFGRETLNEEIAKMLRAGQRVGLFGVHKMGKSSVLERLRKQLEFPVAYVYLQPSDSLGDLYNKILDRWRTDLQVKLPSVDWQPDQVTVSSSPSMAFQDAVHNLLKQLEQYAELPLLGIFLDEIDLWVPQEDDERVVARYVDLMHCLRGLKQETHQISLLVAGAHPTLSRVNLLPGKLKNPLYQVVSERFLEPFSREDCRVMILSLGQQAYVTFDEAAIDAIYRASGGHPYLARRICSIAWKLHGDIGRIPLVTVEEAIADFIRNPSTVSYFDDRALWGELTLQTAWNEESRLANSSILRELSRSEDAMAEGEFRPVPNRQAVERALRALTERCVIQRDPKTGRYDFTFGLFKDWIRHNQL